jgi:hypothetical protein
VAVPPHSAFAAPRRTLTGPGPGPTPEPAPAPVETPAPDPSGAPGRWQAAVRERAPQPLTGGRIGRVTPAPRKALEPDPEPSLGAEGGHWPADPAPVSGRWPEEPAPAKRRAAVGAGAAGGRWPVLPDDTPQWTVVVRREGRERDRYLDEEQRGLPWNA